MLIWVFRLRMCRLRVGLRPRPLLWLLRRLVFRTHWLRVRFRPLLWAGLFRTSRLWPRFWTGGLRMCFLGVRLRPLLGLRPVFRPILRSGYLRLRTVLKPRLLSRPVGHRMNHWRTDHWSGMDIPICLQSLVATNIAGRP